MSGALDEHYGYLSDPIRTECFQRAVTQAVRAGDVVVDLGCGFGVLGLMCLRAGAARVWGIDRTEAIEIARESAERAGFGARYRCIREHSFRVELSEKADLIICDHVGFFGVDYGIIDALADARRRFLKPGGRVIPGAITLLLAGIASADCRRKAEEWAHPAIPADFHWLRSYGINSKHAHHFADSDLATSSGELLTIDLNRDTPDNLRATIDLAAIRDGPIDGLGGWFAAELAPGVTMSNSPLADAPTGREQAFFAFDTPLEAQSGDVIRATISIRHDTGIIAWSAENLRSGEQRSQSTWRSQILSEPDLTPPGARVPRRSPAGIAAQVVASYVDGKRTLRDIEDVVVRDHPRLMPSEAEVRRFVRSELARIAR